MHFIEFTSRTVLIDKHQEGGGDAAAALVTRMCNLQKELYQDMSALLAAANQHSTDLQEKLSDLGAIIDDGPQRLSQSRSSRVQGTQTTEELTPSIEASVQVTCCVGLRATDGLASFSNEMIHSSECSLSCLLGIGRRIMDVACCAYVYAAGVGVGAGFCLGPDQTCAATIQDSDDGRVAPASFEDCAWKWALSELGGNQSDARILLASLRSAAHAHTHCFRVDVANNFSVASLHAEAELLWRLLGDVSDCSATASPGVLGAVIRLQQLLRTHPALRRRTTPSLDNVIVSATARANSVVGDVVIETASYNADAVIQFVVGCLQIPELPCIPADLSIINARNSAEPEPKMISASAAASSEIRRSAVKSRNTGTEHDNVIVDQRSEAARVSEPAVLLAVARVLAALEAALLEQACSSFLSGELSHSILSHLLEFG